MQGLFSDEPFNPEPAYRVQLNVQLAPVIPATPADGLRAGDPAAFSAIVREHQRPLFFHCLRMVRRDQELARDLVQRVFLQAWTNRATFRGDASLRTWLLRIATNLTLNELRRAHRHREVVPEPGPNGEQRELGAVRPLSFEHLETQRQRELLAAAVQTLPPRQRAVVLLRLYEELSFAEIAEVLETKENNAKVHFHHATKSIRRRLAEETS